MRYPESKIKQAILHPEEEMREQALHYFSDTRSQDDTVMPLVAIATIMDQTFPKFREWRKAALRDNLGQASSRTRTGGRFVSARSAWAKGVEELTWRKP